MFIHLFSEFTYEIFLPFHPAPPPPPQCCLGYDAGDRSGHWCKTLQPKGGGGGKAMVITKRQAAKSESDEPGGQCLAYLTARRQQWNCAKAGVQQAWAYMRNWPSQRLQHVHGCYQSGGYCNATAITEPWAYASVSCDKCFLQQPTQNESTTSDAWRNRHLRSKRVAFSDRQDGGYLGLIDSTNGYLLLSLCKSWYEGESQLAKLNGSKFHTYQEVLTSVKDNSKQHEPLEVASLRQEGVTPTLLSI